MSQFGHVSSTQCNQKKNKKNKTDTQVRGLLFNHCLVASCKKCPISKPFIQRALQIKFHLSGKVTQHQWRFNIALKCEDICNMALQR